MAAAKKTATVKPTPVILDDNGTAFLTALGNFLTEYANNASGGTAVKAAPAAEEVAPAAKKAAPAKKAAAKKAEAVEEPEVANPEVESKKGKKKDKGKKGKKDKAEEVVEDEKPSRSDREAELLKTDMRILKKSLIAADYDEAEIKAVKDKKELVAALLAEEGYDSEEEPAADEDADVPEEDDEEDGGDDELDRETLEGLNTKELKKVAKDHGWEAEDLKGIDQEDLINQLLGEEDEFYTEEELEAMSLAELKAIAKEMEIDIPKGVKKADLIELITE